MHAYNGIRKLVREWFAELFHGGCWLEPGSTPYPSQLIAFARLRKWHTLGLSKEIPYVRFVFESSYVLFSHSCRIVRQKRVAIVYTSFEFEIQRRMN